MNTNCRSILAIVLMLFAPFLSYAGSLECQGNFISPGLTMQQLLEACGEPASRKGADWIYKKPGSIPVVVTFGNGVAMFIRDLDEASKDSTSPLGDHP